MACTKKLYSYGSKKKEDKDSTWSGVLKGDLSNDQQTKRLLKKSVWAKAPGKPIHKLNNRIKRDDVDDDPFGFVDDDNKKTLSPGLEKHKMPTKTIYGSPVRPRPECKIFPQDSAAINAQDGTQFSCPEKSDDCGTTDGEGSKCTVKVQSSVSNIDNNYMNKNKTENEIKCSDLRKANAIHEFVKDCYNSDEESLSDLNLRRVDAINDCMEESCNSDEEPMRNLDIKKANAINKRVDECCNSEEALSMSVMKDRCMTANKNKCGKVTNVDNIDVTVESSSDRKFQSSTSAKDSGNTTKVQNEITGSSSSSKCGSNIQSTAKKDAITNEIANKLNCEDITDTERTKTEKTLVFDNLTVRTTCRSPTKTKSSNIKAVVSTSPNKTKPINIEPVVRVTKLNSNLCKKAKTEKDYACKPVKPVKPIIPAKPNKPQLECGSVPVQFIDDNTVLIIRQKETKGNNKKKTKSRKAGYDEKRIKTNSKEDQQMLNDGNIFNILSNESDASLSHKPLPSKNDKIEQETLSKKGRKENHSFAAHGAEDVWDYLDESEDLPGNKLDHNITLEEKEDELPLSLISKSPYKSPLKRTVTRKRSLFSYYDKHDVKPSDNPKEFDFVSEFDDLPNSDDTCGNSDASSIKERSDSFSITAPASKKNKLEDPFLGVGDVCGDSSNPVEKVQPANALLKSPFKLKKQSSGLRNTRCDRRFSSLPTDITLEGEDMEEPFETDEIKTPPPLYRSSFFGFRKSVGSDDKIRVRRDEKELYTVVRNTRNAHECLEFGQTQQFKDDLEYLLDGLKPSHNVSTRCLSALELASKCMSRDFRMHIKAHGIIESIFMVMEDAFSEEQLLLCATVILFVLAKDKLKINFEKKSISFMLQVITKKRECSNEQPNIKTIKKIRAILEKLEDINIDIDTLDATVLAREAMLSLTVKQTGDWFKDEIRELGGLDDVADTVYSCCQCIQKGENTDKSCILMKRCLGLFSDMSYKNTANQAYLLSCRNSVVIESCVRTLHTITTSMDKEKITPVVADCLMSIELLLMNLSHENKNACIKICKQEYGLDAILRSALHLSRHLPANVAYENTIVSLCLLINLVAHHPQNKIMLNKKLTTGYSGIQSTDPICEDTHLKPVKALMQMFLLHSEACKEADLMQELEKLEREESEQDAAKHYQEDEYALTCGDKFEDTIDEPNGELSSIEESKKDADGPLNETEKRDIKSTLDKAQRHMEDSHLAAYAGLLIGLLVEDDTENQDTVHSLLPDGDFTVLRDCIEKILSFMEMTNPLSKTDQDCMKRIVQIISDCDEQYKEKG